MTATQTTVEVTITPSPDGATVMIRLPKSEPEPPALIRLRNRIVLARLAVLVERYADCGQNGYLYAALRYPDAPMTAREAALVVSQIAAQDGNWTGSL